MRSFQITGVRALIRALESDVIPKQKLTLYKVALTQYSGEAVAKQSVRSTHPYPRKLASCNVLKTHWSMLTPVKNIVRAPILRRILSSGVSQNPLIRCFSTSTSSGRRSSSSTTAVPQDSFASNAPLPSGDGSPIPIPFPVGLKMCS